MSRTAWASTKREVMVIVAVAILFAFAVPAAKADPCAQNCRSEHNTCRMAAKLLFSARCDAQLQACISQCFAANRLKRMPREDRGPPDLRDRRGPPELHGPPDDRGPPPHEFRDHGARGLGGHG